MIPETVRAMVDFHDEERAEDLLIELMAQDYDHTKTPLQNAVFYIDFLRRNPGH